MEGGVTVNEQAKREARKLLLWGTIPLVLYGCSFLLAFLRG